MAYISFQPKDYFNTKLYSGSGSTTTLTGVGFQPDWTWIKRRNSSINHKIYDAVRTAGKSISSNNTAVEITNDAEGYLSAFTSDGFTVQAGTTSDEYVNQTGGTYVAWNWLANGAGSSNTDGSITSTVSANTTSGFSIVSYTGNSTAGATIGHGLGVKPSMIITKQLSGDVAEPVVYHTSTGATKFFKLNESSAVITNSTLWNDTEPTSTLFTVGTAAPSNASHPMIAYCFAPVRGFSSMGSYVGNGSTDGSFIYTGMSPAFIMVKRTNTTEGWYMYDVKRDTFNVSDAYLTANTSNAEATLTNGLDILSNGFKMRNTDTGHNASGSTYIYMAFSDQSIVSSNGIPAVAR